MGKVATAYVLPMQNEGTEGQEYDCNPGVILLSHSMSIQILCSEDLRPEIRGYICLSLPELKVPWLKAVCSIFRNRCKNRGFQLDSSLAIDEKPGSIACSPIPFHTLSCSKVYTMLKICKNRQMNSGKLMLRLQSSPLGYFYHSIDQGNIFSVEHQYSPS